MNNTDKEPTAPFELFTDDEVQFAVKLLFRDHPSAGPSFAFCEGVKFAEKQFIAMQDSKPSPVGAAGEEEPHPIKAGDKRILVNGRPLPVDFRIISEENYQTLRAQLEEADRERERFRKALERIRSPLSDLQQQAKEVAEAGNNIAVRELQSQVDSLTKDLEFIKGEFECASVFLPDSKKGLARESLLRVSQPKPSEP